MTTPEKYYVRFSNLEDHQKIIEFYKLNAHENVRDREEALIKVLADEGSVVLIEDTAGKIVASSITYPHRDLDAEGIERVKWEEIGSTRMTLNGYPGLFDVMIGMQVLRAFLVEPPEDCFVAQMHYAAIQKTAHRLGWRAYEVKDALLNSKIETIDANGSATVSKENWFRLTVEGLPTLAKEMVKALDKKYLEHVKSGERIELDFSKSVTFQIFEENIRRLAKASYGDIDAPDPKKKIKAYNSKLLRRKFK